MGTAKGMDFRPELSDVALILESIFVAPGGIMGAAHAGSAFAK